MNPLNLLAVISPPPGTPEHMARAQGRKTLFIGLVILVAGIGLLTAISLLPRATATAITDASHDRVTYVNGAPMSATSALIYALIFPAGLGYLMVVAGMFRWMLGMPSPNVAVRFLRKTFGFILFLLTFVVSLLAYGQVLQLVNP